MAPSVSLKYAKETYKDKKVTQMAVTSMARIRILFKSAINDQQKNRYMIGHC